MENLISAGLFKTESSGGTKWIILLTIIKKKKNNQDQNTTNKPKLTKKPSKPRNTVILPGVLGSRQSKMRKVQDTSFYFYYFYFSIRLFWPLSVSHGGKEKLLLNPSFLLLHSHSDSTGKGLKRPCHSILWGNCRSEPQLQLPAWPAGCWRSI